MNKTKYVKYPYEYFAAQVEFGLAVSRVLKKRKIEVFKKYTDIYGAVTDHRFADTPNSKWVPNILKKLDYALENIVDSKELSTYIYDLFLSTPYIYEEYPSKYINEPLRFGCFKLNYSNYYQHLKVVRLHFSPLRNGLDKLDKELRTSDLADVYMSDRKEEFRNMITYIFNNPEEFKGATHFYSSTWLQNLPAYKSFFPRTKRKLEDTVFYWIWGQFIKWDYSGNKYRLEEFASKLTQAKNIKQVIDAIPYKVYEVKIPLKRMFDFYGLSQPVVVETESFVDASTEFAPLEFLSNHLLPSQTAYQLEE